MSTQPTALHQISPRRFFAELDILRETLLKMDGIPFESFTRGTPYSWEGYKDEVYAEARRRLAIEDWNVGDAGTGSILERVIQAVEIKGNNLLKWAQYGAHNVLSEVRSDSRCFAVESLLCDFYKGELEAEETFDPLVDILGKKYPLIAYLFFIKDCDRFLPISPENFDEVFVRLGVDLKTSGRCGWDNYSAYLGVIRQVRKLLQSEGYESTRQLDAHSFCWMLANLEMVRTAEYPPVRIEVIDQLPGIPDESPRAPVDWEALQRARAELGRLGEEYAEAAEKDRLRAAGKRALADKVRLVSDNHSLGYDLHSYEIDGRDRLIEVKAISGDGADSRFFTTWRQLELAHSGVNHYYYLVRGARTPNPMIQAIRAKDIPPSAMRAIVHEVVWNASPT